MIHATAAIARARHSGFSLEEVTLEPPKADEVLVRIKATGICHTDIGARDGYFPVPELPVILGHEGAGIVEAVGEDISGVSPGDHVVLSFAYCGKCPNCQAGMPYLCQYVFPLNFTGLRADGSCGHCDKSGAQVRGAFFGQSSFATYSVVKHNNIVVVPKDIPLELLAPLGCGIQTGAGTVLNALDVQPGDSVAVFGCGAVGLSAVMAAKLAGCSQILAVDINQERLKLAQTLGADVAFIAGDDLVERIMTYTNGAGVRYSVEAAGVPAALRQAVDILSTPGTCALISGVPAGTEMKLDMAAFLIGKTLTGLVEGASVPQRFIPELIAHYQAGRFPLDQLIQTYAFDNINAALADAESGAAIKPVLLMP
ncbi:MAG: NAD(P)-dependent alcohol dehydrogenase [Pseudomonadota bacterium]